MVRVLGDSGSLYENEKRVAFGLRPLPELAGVEMVSTIVYQLTKDLTEEEIQKSGFDTYFVDHTTGVYPADANGMPFSASTFSVAGDALTDLHEDLAAEYKSTNNVR